MKDVYTTVSGISIPLNNIDYVGPVERPYWWGYSIYTKSNNKIWIDANDSNLRASDDRKKLIENLSNYLKNDSGSSDS